MEVFETVVKAIGPEAGLFKEEQMLILFGLDAPDTLKDYCFNIEVNPVLTEIKAGMTLAFDDQEYEITAVGDLVSKNLSDLGHITIKLDGAATAELPGTLYVSAGNYPEIELETVIKIA
ncbi:PTS glucitol/sorbitol transporter subunit IIA [Vagococcus salmoninarum]|uniref:PTS glucitol/sorbitol transporter subunit IIA n=1 Tax=Vagococcus salmoninarum TaxID=2739 RepID=UPI003F9C4148